MIGSQPIRIQLGKILRENLVGKSCGTRRRGKSQFKKGSDWWKFSIWNRVMGSQPIRIQLGKILRENLAGNSCRKILWEILQEILVGNAVGKFPIPISKPFLKVIFKICNSSRSMSFSLVNVKNSFLSQFLADFYI